MYLRRRLNPQHAFLVVVLVLCAVIAQTAMAANTPRTIVQAGAAVAPSVAWQGKTYTSTGALRAAVRKSGVGWERFLRTHPRVVTTFGLAPLRWDGQTFYSQSGFASWLKLRNTSYRSWALSHPVAHQRLQRNDSQTVVRRFSALSSSTSTRYFGFSNGSRASSADELRQGTAIGASLLRVDAQWAYMERSRGVYDWSGWDRLVANAKATGAKLIACIAFTPAWARPNLGYSGWDANTQEPTDAGEADYARFAAAFAARYAGSGVLVGIEIWNEPNISQFWKPKPNPVKYTRMLKLAHNAIKQVAPALEVMTGGLAPAGSYASHPVGGSQVNPVRFLESVYANGGRGHFDAVGHHPFDFGGAPSTTHEASGWYQMYGTSPSLRSLMVANGDGAKRIHATQFGVPSQLSAYGEAFSEEKQRKTIADSTKAWKSFSWAGHLALYLQRDGWNGGNGTWFYHYGLQRANGSGKPAWFAYRDAIAADQTSPPAPVPAPTPTPDTQPPSVPGALTAGTKTVSSITVTWSASTDNVGVAAYGYYRNGAAVGNGTGTSYTFGGLTCGTSYTLAVDAYDAAGNRSSKATTTTSTEPCLTPAPAPAPVPPPASSTRYFGFANGGRTSSADELRQAVAIGAPLLRIDAQWAYMEPSRGTYDWSGWDAVVAAAKATGAKLIACVAYTPSWARPNLGYTGWDANTQEPTDAAEADYARFAGAFAARYGGSGVLVAVEIWNEANISQFWKPKPNPVKYTRMLKLAYNAVKQVAPNLEVMTSGNSPVGSYSSNPVGGDLVNPVRFLEAVYANGGRGHFDAVGHHPYDFGGAPHTTHVASAWYQMYGTSPSLRSLMVANGDGAKRIHATEFGIPTQMSAYGHTFSEEKQRQMIGDAARAWKTFSWAGHFAVYLQRDGWNGGNGTWFYHYGLQYANGAGKPGWFAYRDAIAQN